MDKKNTDTETIHIAPALLFVTLCAIACYFVLFSPVKRQIGLTFRNTLYIFPVILLTAWFCCSTQNRYLRTVLMCLLFSFVLFPYSGMLNSGLSDQYALGGVVPWSDAFTMQLNTQRFLYGGAMEQAAAVRPLSLVSYGLFLYIFNNNYFALHIFLCIIIAICMLFTMDEVNRLYGSITAAFFFTVLFFYIRQRLGTYMTEPYGFICALLSARWILKGLRTNRQYYFIFGFLMLSIALNARPAAMFLFPAFGLWYFFVYMKEKSHRILWAAAALASMLAGFGMNRLAQIAVYGKESIPNRQAAEMVYGLCLGGKSWGDVTSLPEMIALNDSQNVIKDVAGLCAPILKEHPENLFKAIKTIYYDSLIKSPFYGAFSFINGNPKQINSFVRYGFIGLWLAGFILLLLNRKEHPYSLLLAGAIGIILSEMAAVPFSSNYLRLYAVSMWIPACITGITPQFLYERLLKNNESKKRIEDPGPERETVSCILGLFITITVLFGPEYIKNRPLYRPSVLYGKCKNDEEILIASVDKGSYIYLEEQPSLSFEHIPYFRLPYVRQHIHDTASIEMFPFTDAIDEPTAIIRSIDLGILEDSLIFSPLELVENREGYAMFCGHFIDPPILRDDRFFIPTSVTFYKDGL